MKNVFSTKKALFDLNRPRGYGKKVGLKTALHSGQINAIKPLIDGDIQTLLVASGRKFGKMTDLEELIFTPDRGYIRYGDLKQGDSIYDEKGNVQKVLQLHPIDNSPKSYRVHFCNGTYLDACADHRWLTWTKSDRKNFKRGLKSYNPSVKSTQEIFETQIHGKEFNHSIPYTKPLQMDEKDLLIDPYTLGAWLGDGSRSSGVLTNVDKEVIEEIRKNYKVTSGKLKKEWYIRSLVGELRELGVYKNKHVPHEYLMGSIDQRYSLLQGLMDTDGTINKAGNSCTFDNTNKDLAEAVYHLVASLGMKPIWKERMGKLYGAEKKRCYRVFFHPMGNEIFKIKRKQDRVAPLKKTAHHTIVKVEEIPPKPMRCITVSGDSHLYLLGKSLIPTHNTEICLYLLWRQAVLHPGSACYYVAPTREQAKKLLWDVRRLHNYMPSSYIQGRPHERDLMIRLKNGSFIQLMGSENYEAANGLSPHLIIYDEFKAFHPSFHRTMGPNRVTHGAKLAVIGTMADDLAINKKEYWALKDFCEKSPNAKVHIATTWDNPINQLPNQKKAIEAEIELLEARGDYDVVQREFYSKIVPGGSRAIFPQFSEKKHVRKHDLIMEEIGKDLNDMIWISAMDPGTARCWAGLFIAIHPYTKKIYVLDEIYETDQNKTHTTALFPEIMKKAKELNPYKVLNDWILVYDEAAKWAAKEIWAQYGVSYMPTMKAANKKEEGISLLKDIFAHDLVYVSDRCKNLKEEIISYAKNERGEIPKNDKVEDHAIDSFRYALYACNYDLTEALRKTMEKPDEFYERNRPLRDSDILGDYFGDFVSDFEWD